ncbi:hypothetical protein TSAR_012701 [Trichomalopsis sarcophagae]|uniref:Uncharacterized protein n=1 Tax=Trichomalopsis sarcophagae TaxID=543379 RepID=A0A232ETK3_9HYME|nr:hypothetical protein TSAR_012701 [Trichomalopsis sarcophagae]
MTLGAQDHQAENGALDYKSSALDNEFIVI